MDSKKAKVFHKMVVDQPVTLENAFVQYSFDRTLPEFTYDPKKELLRQGYLDDFVQPPSALDTGTCS